MLCVLLSSPALDPVIKSKQISNTISTTTRLPRCNAGDDMWDLNDLRTWRDPHAESLEDPVEEQDTLYLQVYHLVCYWC